MKKGVELRKIVTIVNWNDIKDFIPEKEKNHFYYDIMLENDQYVVFRNTPHECVVKHPFIENYLHEVLEINYTDIILIENIDL